LILIDRDSQRSIDAGLDDANIEPQKRLCFIESDRPVVRIVWYEEMTDTHGPKSRLIAVRRELYALVLGYEVDPGVTDPHPSHPSKKEATVTTSRPQTCHGRLVSGGPPC
jgi:hypothetical protein